MEMSDRGIKYTEWPRLSGLMSRKAKTFSFSKSLNDGISPVRIVLLVPRAAASAIDTEQVPAGLRIGVFYGPLMILQKMQDAILLLISV